MLLKNKNYAPDLTAKDFSLLDSLRGIASLYVCVAHCRGVLWVGVNQYLVTHPRNTWGITDYLITAVASLTKLSGEAVIFFFVLSGFSIMHSLSRQPQIQVYLLKRLIRLYPPYLLGIALACIVVSLLKTDPGVYFSGKYTTPLFVEMQNSLSIFNAKNFIAALFYQVPPNSILAPYWSLIYEVIFYALAPLLLRFGKSYYWLSIIAFLIGIAFEYILHIDYSKYIIYNFIFHYNFYFMIGVYVYRNYKKIEMQSWVTSSKWTVLALAGYVSMIALESIIGEKFRLSFLLAGITCTLFIINFIKKQINTVFLNFIGKFSYTLYLVHFSVIFFICWILFSILHITPPYITSFLLWIPAVGVCVLVAYGMYFLAEKPSQLLLQRIRGGKRR